MRSDDSSANVGFFSVCAWCGKGLLAGTRMFGLQNFLHLHYRARIYAIPFAPFMYLQDEKHLFIDDHEEMKLARTKLFCCLDDAATDSDKVDQHSR